MSMARAALLVSAILLSGLLSGVPAHAEPPPRPIPVALDLATVRRVIHRDGRAALQACWREERARGSIDRGRLLLLFTVAANGRVSRVEILSNELGPTLAQCAAAAIRSEAK